MTDRTKEYKEHFLRSNRRSPPLVALEGDLPRERAKVHLHYSTVMEETCRIIRTRLGIPHDAYLDPKGRLVCDERDHRHGSIGEDLLDPEPSAEVRHGLAVIATIEGLKLRFIKADET
jgi:hypothetical protein